MRTQYLCALTLLVSTGCTAAGSQAVSPAPDPLAGEVSASGGGGALDTFTALTSRFAERHPGLFWFIEEVGSDAGVALVASGSADLGFTSRDLREAERGTVEKLSIGATGTGVAVSPRNPVGGLTTEQVRGIFSGDITDWSEVGGNPGRIRVLIREKESSTRASFESSFFDDSATYARGTIEVYELEETLSAISSFADAIGMATVDHRTVPDLRIKFLAIDGAAATLDNLNSGQYRVRRPLFIVYHPEPARVKPAVRAFLDWVAGPEGQKVLASL